MFRFGDVERSAGFVGVAVPTTLPTLGTIVRFRHVRQAGMATETVDLRQVPPANHPSLTVWQPKQPAALRHTVEFEPVHSSRHLGGDGARRTPAPHRPSGHAHPQSQVDEQFPHRLEGRARASKSSRFLMSELHWLIGNYSRYHYSQWRSGRVRSQCLHCSEAARKVTRSASI